MKTDTDTKQARAGRYLAESKPYRQYGPDYDRNLDENCILLERKYTCSYVLANVQTRLQRKHGLVEGDFAEQLERNYQTIRDLFGA